MTTAESSAERDGSQDQSTIKLAVDNSQSSSAPPHPDGEDDGRRAKAPPPPDESHDLQDLLKDSQKLLRYAAQAGIPVDDCVVQPILSSIKKEKLSDTEALAVLKAVTTLSTKLKPVTAETLAFCREAADKTVRSYFRRTLRLGIPLVFLSIFSFVAASLSKSINDEIAVATTLAVALNAENAKEIEGPGANVAIDDERTLTNLARFAASIRRVEGLSGQLQPFVLDFGDSPTEVLQSAAAKDTEVKVLELRVPATIGQIKEKTEQLQLVRAHATQLQARENIIYGAIANCILPSLYAILGALAYLLKTFSEQRRARSFRPSEDADIARFIIAAIGGGVVGLFNNFTLTPGTSLSVFAIAFLIGYATEVFFSFLDGLQQTFTKAKPG